MGFPIRLLLDARVVDLPMACNPTLIILSSFKALVPFRVTQSSFCIYAAF
jgi:hypothetical protein